MAEHVIEVAPAPTIRWVADMATQRRPQDPVFAQFLPAYYRELPEFDVDDRRADDLYAVALAHYMAGRVRQPGKTVVTVTSPDRELDGWYSERTVVLIVTDDAPFLVDTIRIVLERHLVGTHLLVHPTLHVRRDEDGTLTEILPARREGASDDDLVEAWTQVEIDRCEADLAERLQAELAVAVETVHRAVADFVPMRERMLASTDADPLLGWLAANHFVFLGAAVYDVGPDGPVCREGSTLGELDVDSPVDPPIEAAVRDDGHPVVSVARSSRVASVHRASRMTAVTVLRRDADGAVTAERFIGLLAASAYRAGVLTIPTVGDRARAVLGLALDGPETHTGRSMRNVLETLPRDLVFELDADSLAQLVIDIVGLQERQIVRVFDVPEPVGALSTVLVYLPKNRFTADLPERIADLVGAAYGSSVRDLESYLGTSTLARVTFTVERSDDTEPDLDALSDAVDELTTSWIERVREAALHEHGDERGSRLVTRCALVAPAGYRTNVDPTTAVGDLDRIVAMLDAGDQMRLAFTHEVGGEDDVWRVRVYSKDTPIELADLLPTLDHVGLRALDEHPYRFEIDGVEVFVYDVGVRLPSGVNLDRRTHDEVVATLIGLLDGEVEADGFNRLLLLAGITAAQVNVLRAYAKYAHQIGFTFSQSYIEGSLAGLPHLARLLVDLFEAKFDPDLPAGDRLPAMLVAEEAVIDALDDVPSLDDDRIGRTYLELIRATVRTSVYQGRPTLAFKFNPTLVPDLPAPRPAHEIFVCSPRVEGVHLRGGAIARGGLRWSDRPEDYRTEVLGLVKAQMVKNAVIVPVGAKGGFVVKRQRAVTDQREEVVECYRAFVSGLLDLTDNVVDGRIVHPERTVRYDGDDPYLVVAADKGTATFSDVANGIAAECGFWLGDAFASGGSAGYDHKAMGITARGAWESVRTHARVLGKNADTDELTVVGVGDMSGDVFGNGMLRSPHLKLIAAFDHRHVFVDPTPDPAASFEERKRLYETPRSSWADYDEALISPGGGVFARSAKSIDVTPEMQAALGIEAQRLTPNELIKAVLTAPVDVLWNGGIGTYVKASTETNGDVGDRQNDGVRVDASDLRCQILAEGGNLGVTQRGRIEYALAGGLVHTDAIDNSAGVDCSDHEVNIKIALGDAVESGRLTATQRDELLAQMTDEVAELVLQNNRAQTLALMIARRQALSMVNVHARYLDLLEQEGWLDRALEFLPTDKQIAERQSNGVGLTAPELAVLIAYTKNANVTEILQTDLPDALVLQRDVIDYFPVPLRETYRDEILRHRLRREIATTQLANQMVNLSGISYDHRMTEDTGASVTDVSRAWLVAREVLGFPEWWEEIGRLTGVALDDQLELYMDCRRTAERCSLWFLRHRRPPVDIDAEIAHFTEPFHELAQQLAACVTGSLRQAMTDLTEARHAAGVPLDLAERASVWRLLHTTFDMIEVADRAGVPPLVAASAYWAVFDRLELLWLWDEIGYLPRADRWQTQARGALRDDLLTILAELTSSVLDAGDGSVDGWLSANDRAVQRTVGMLTEIRRADHFDFTNLSVALRQLRNLAQTSIRGA